MTRGEADAEELAAERFDEDVVITEAMAQATQASVTDDPHMQLLQALTLTHAVVAARLGRLLDILDERLTEGP